MEKAKQLASGVCQFIDRQIEYYQECKMEFQENKEIVEYFKGLIEGLQQARSEIIREVAFVND